MKKKVMSILVASAFALALSFPMATSADPGPLTVQDAHGDGVAH